MARVLFSKTVQDNAGNIQPEARVRVFVHGTSTLVDVYDVETGGSPLSQPLSVDSQATLWFFVEPGRYDLELTIPLGVTIDPIDLRGFTLPVTPTPPEIFVQAADPSPVAYPAIWFQTGQYLDPDLVDMFVNVP